MTIFLLKKRGGNRSLIFVEHLSMVLSNCHDKYKSFQFPSIGDPINNFYFTRVTFVLLKHQTSIINDDNYSVAISV